MNEIIRLGQTIEGASVSAINRAAKSAVTAVSKHIRETYNIKKKDLDERIGVIGRASGERMYATVRVRRGDVRLLLFGAKQIGRPGRSKRGVGPRLSEGVRAMVRRGDRRLYRSSDNARGYFIAKMKSGHVGVFVRDMSDKIKERYGIDITQRIVTKGGNSKAMEILAKTFTEVYEKRLNHELLRRVLPD
jgi:hypothetical protein